MSQRPRLIGLTGGIGSGKTTVAKMLAELGAHVINADRVGHQVYANGTVGWDQVVKRFGDSIVGEDGEIDRKKLSGIVFGDEQALADLNAIVHPLIGQEIARRVQGFLALDDGMPVVLEAAILVEAKWTEIADQVWVVSAQPDDIVERVRVERAMSEQETRSRMKAQLSDAERRAAADVLIENVGTFDELRAQVEAAWRNALG